MVPRRRAPTRASRRRTSTTRCSGRAATCTCPATRCSATAAAWPASRSLDRARLRGMTTSVDVASAGPIADTGPARFLSWVSGVDVLLANESEAALLAGLPEPDQSHAATALESAYLRRRHPRALGRHGRGEARPARRRAGRAADGTTAHAEAVPVDVVDTTGAGDAFAAGFLPAWTAGADPRSCARGAATGRRSAWWPGWAPVPDRTRRPGIGRTRGADTLRVRGPAARRWQSGAHEHVRAHRRLPAGPGHRRPAPSCRGSPSSPGPRGPAAQPALAGHARRRRHLVHQLGMAVARGRRARGPRRHRQLARAGRSSAGSPPSPSRPPGSSSTRSRAAPAPSPCTQVQIGAYGAAIGGFMTLILAAVAVDTRVPTVR